MLGSILADITVANGGHVPRATIAPTVAAAAAAAANRRT
jgi:hypothetical protein